MATLVLTAVGTAIGGPIAGALGASLGGAIGGLAGQAIDAHIFRPGARTGPRLADLQVQTSRYGAQVPRLYGTIRAAGTVIWATDLRETSATSGGGKGRPDLTSYSYSASLAVALSARPISGIGRIWADGNLLRGAAGDWKSPLGAFRMHHGGEDQPRDPLIAAALGVDQTPAHRGCAYVVFEDLQLADFGNRIPSLSFEIIADEAPLGVSAILADMAGRPIEHAGGEDEPMLAGFAADGASLREAAGVLIEVHDLLWRESGGALAVTGGVATDVVIDPTQDVLAVDGRAQGLPTKRRAPLESVPVRLGIRHHDPERDFQLGVQTAERPGPGLRSDTLDLPAVLPPTAARRLADRKLRAATRRRVDLHRAAGWSALEIGIGDIVALADDPGRWLVEARDWDDMAVRLRLRAFEPGARPIAAGGESGEPVRQPDLVQGPTSLAIVELPGDGATLATRPILHAAATGADAGWRRAALFRYQPGSAEPIGRTAPRAVLGVTATALPDGPPWRIDRRGSVEVQLDNAADALVSVGEGLLVAGANLCQIGEEILQFARADPAGPGRYRLSRLIRGWHGTEWAAGMHEAGERFVLIEAARLASVPASIADMGGPIALRAVGSGDVVPAEAARMVDGRAMLPPSPVHGRVIPTNDGGRSIAWVRRSRLGWTWPEHGEVPLGEEQECYLVEAVAGGTVLRAWETTAPGLLYPAAAHAEDSAAGDPWPLTLEIRQRGTWGPSRPLVLPLP